MALSARNSYVKAKDMFVNYRIKQGTNCVFKIHHRKYNDDKTPEFSSSTIFVENGFNVQELPIIIRKLKDITNMNEIPAEPNKVDSSDYRLIQAEFGECIDLKDIFSLLSKCTKITPNIALGAMERIYDIEKEPNALLDDLKGNHIHLAKGAIIDKLLKVITKTEDTQTILNVLRSMSSFMDHFKESFCDELLFRTIDNKLTIEQICMFANFLMENKSNSKYTETIDKLWVGFIQKDCDISETNIAMVFSVLSGLKVSKRIVLSLLEQKFVELWCKINIPNMQEILNSFVEEKYLSLDSFLTVGKWLYTNIHALDEDALLNIVSKITRLKYTDDQIEKAIEKYMRLKGDKIESHVLIVGILNYCLQFQIRNQHILNCCSNYFIRNIRCIPPSFLKSYIYPFGFLYFDPDNSTIFWKSAETVLLEQLPKISIEDISSIILSYIYVGKYPLNLVTKVFTTNNLSKVVKPEVWKTLHLIDTSLSLECASYTGPLIPKDKWSQPFAQDSRIKNIICKIYPSFEAVVHSDKKISTAVMIPHFSDEIYLIDVLLHASGFGGAAYNWKKELSRNKNIAVLIHLPDHYCSDNDQLTGLQVLRKKHLRILGFKVASVKYSILSQFYTTCNTNGLKQYLINCINGAEDCL